MSTGSSETPETSKSTPETASDRYECRACGYVYEPSKGDGKRQVPPGTPFEELPEGWRCPICGAQRRKFENIGAGVGTSGFAENMGYGFGVNGLTPSQKNLLIFGGLGLGLLFLLSLYGLQ